MMCGRWVVGVGRVSVCWCWGKDGLYVASCVEFDESFQAAYIVRACALDMGLDSRFDVRIVCLDDDSLNEMDSERFVLQRGNVVSYWYYPYMQETQVGCHLQTCSFNDLSLLWHGS